MKIKVKVSGGQDWFSDEEVIWKGFLPYANILHIGSVIQLNTKTLSLPVRDMKLTLRIDMIAAEIDDKDPTYVFYVSPVDKVNANSLKSIFS